MTTGRTYQWLANGLDSTADHARNYFATSYGAKSFMCETEIDPDLPLKPTWQASTQGFYKLCVEVMTTISLGHVLLDFVSKCSTGGHPILLWVVIPQAPGGSNVAVGDLKECKRLGLGVGAIDEHGKFEELRQPVPLSLSGLRPLNDLARAPTKKRELLKKAHDGFLNGSPVEACQALHQELEAITRAFAAYSYKSGWWKTKPPPSVVSKGAPKQPKDSFFEKESWAHMLTRLDEEIQESLVKKKCSTFRRDHVAAVRGKTQFRNSVSHKPKNVKELRQRDQKLRTEFETVMDMLFTWFEIERKLKF